MYHSICSQTGDNRWSVSLKSFFSQLGLLISEGWQTLRVADLAKPEVYPKRSVIITFDDGYADNFAAFEALAKQGMVATWFVVTGDLGGNASWSGIAASNAKLLSISQLKEMLSAGMEIGAHSRTHPWLTEIDDIQLQQEVAGARCDLSKALGISIDSFAYPYGDFDERVTGSVRSAGYQAACSTQSGWVFSRYDPYRLRRVAIYGQDSLAAFARKLAFADNDVGWQRTLSYLKNRIAKRMV